MNDIQKKVLRNHHGDILKNLVLDQDMLGYLLHKDILTEASVQTIQAKSSQHEKITELLLLLPKRGSKAFPIFLEGVKKYSPFLGDKLEMNYEKGKKQ
ncbi:caspase-2-like [Ruditapes philippinarum]|uniref:caspase-2-like n=1 Tax=Ruditapes philippinarum TaxID=129788 RepID=UPI00295ABE60|nr:caspase-2-like [Ruditapes philippinarum]